MNRLNLNVVTGTVSEASPPSMISPSPLIETLKLKMLLSSLASVVLPDDDGPERPIRMVCRSDSGLELPCSPSPDFVAVDGGEDDMSSNLGRALLSQKLLFVSLLFPSPKI